MGKRILVIRHGETIKEKLIKNNFINKSKNIALYISFFKNYKKIYFVSSPIERCIETAEMVITEVNNLLKTNYINTIDNNLKRWDKKYESREDSYIRAMNYRDQVKKIDSDLIVIFTHSSMVNKLVFGLVKKKINTKEYKNIIKNNKKLIHGSVSVVKFDKNVKYNIDDDILINNKNNDNFLSAQV